LAAVCSVCGAQNRIGHNFCAECGTALDSVPGPAKFGSAKSYTPRHLAEKILTSRSALEGERKQVTVLFADLKGSMELLADRDPEEARRLLDPVLECMMEAVHRYEGTVNQVMGDGIMAIFGAPLSHEDHAVRACYAALRMQDKIAQLAAEMRKAQGVSIQIRTGLNSGEVLVRSIGNDLRMDYTAVGQSTHLASRMEQLATPGSILITADCLRLAEGYIETRSLGPVALKGFAVPVEVHEVVAAAPVRSRLQAAAARGLTPFVGRRLEMEALHEALRRAAERKGQVLAVVGQAGVGKSRLLHEFIHSPHARGWLVLESKSISYGRATPYLPLIDFLKGYFKLVEREDARSIREKVTGKIILLDQSLQDAIPAVLDLLGALPEGHAFRQLEPAQRQQLTARAVTRLMASESLIQPVIMAFEDLHWNDALTLGLLRAVITSIRESRILLLVSYRPKEPEKKSADATDQLQTQPQGDYEKWDDQPHYRQIRLAPLAHESLEQLLQILIGADPLLASVKNFLVERTGGNPFFVEELIRSLVETGVLSGSRGHYRLAKPFSTVEVPATVWAVLSARIDRLDQDQKRLLQEAAVIGKDVPFVLLQAIAGIPEAELRARLAELQAAEYLYESRLFPDLEYTFKHSLTREVAYSILLRERTKPLHARVAQELLQLTAGRVEEHVDQVAEHAEKGELWPMAVEYLQRSGEKAFALYANLEAADYFDRALKALTHLPETRATLEQAVDLRFELRNALIALSELIQIRQCLEAAESIIAGLGDRARTARLASFKCNHHFLAAEHRRAIEVGEAGLRLAREIGDSRLEAELLYRVGQSYHLLGDNRTAIALIEQGIAGAGEQRRRDRFDLAVIPAVGSRMWLVTILAECGDFKSGLKQARRALEIAVAAQHPLSEVLGWLAVGHVLRRQGDLEEATEALENGIALSDRYSMRMWRLRLVSALGVAHAYCGRLVEGLELTREALAGAEKMHLMVDQPMLHVHVGEALLLGGRMDEAIAHGRRALEIAVAHENRRDEPWTRLLIARAHWASDPLAIEEPTTQLDAAMRLAAAAGAKPLEAHCQVMLGLIHGRSGNRAKAEKFAAAAATTYASLGMRPLVLAPLGERSPAT
jgi:class 3 adenylate cyclase/tetratricopeptide (TPR) repeat protein